MHRDSYGIIFNVFNLLPEKRPVCAFLSGKTVVIPQDTLSSTIGKLVFKLHNFIE